MLPRLAQDALYGQKRSLRKAAAKQLQGAARDEVARELVAALRRASKPPLPETDAALDLLTKWPAPVGVPVLVELWAKADRPVDTAADEKVARYLGRASAREAASEALAAALERPDPAVRSAALRLWSHMRPVDASVRLGILHGLQDYDYACRFEALRLAVVHPEHVPASDLAARLPVLEGELFPSGVLPMTNAESALAGMLYSLVQGLEQESEAVAAFCVRYERQNAFAVVQSAIWSEDLEHLDALLARGRPYEGRYAVLRPDRITTAATDVVASVGFGLFQWAWPNGNPSKVLSRLLAAGMPVNEVCGMSSPLHTAAQRGDLVAVELLLAAGADPNLENPLAQTPTDEAVRNAHLGRPHGNEVLARLEAHGGRRAGSRESSKLAARSDEHLASLCRYERLVSDAAAVLAERRELSPRAYRTISDAIEEIALPGARPARGEWDPLVLAMGQCPPRWLLCPAFFALHRGLDVGLARFAAWFTADPEAAAAGRQRWRDGLTASVPATRAAAIAYTAFLAVDPAERQRVIAEGLADVAPRVQAAARGLEESAPGGSPKLSSGSSPGS